jgi:hypothetical protein
MVEREDEATSWRRDGTGENEWNLLYDDPTMKCWRCWHEEHEEYMTYK